MIRIEKYAFTKVVNSSINFPCAERIPEKTERGASLAAGLLLFQTTASDHLRRDPQ
jgi:hypothetical protein